MSDDDAMAGAGYLGYTGGWGPVVALAEPLESGAPDAVQQLLREAHRAGLVTSFDWPTWMTGRGRELTGDLEAIDHATLEECRRLLVAHLRRDRFVVGHLRAMIDAGEVPAILRRAGAITAAKQAAMAANGNGRTAATTPPAATAGPPHATPITPGA